MNLLVSTIIYTTEPGARVVVVIPQSNNTVDILGSSMSSPTSDVWPTMGLSVLAPGLGHLESTADRGGVAAYCRPWSACL